MGLNWTDNATNEAGDAVYISTDNVNFAFLGQTASNSTGATVTADVIGPVKGPKIDTVKYRRRKGYRRKIGHRQQYTTIEITGIRKG